MIFAIVFTRYLVLVPNDSVRRSMVDAYGYVALDVQIFQGLVSPVSPLARQHFFSDVQVGDGKELEISQTDFGRSLGMVYAHAGLQGGIHPVRFAQHAGQRWKRCPCR